MNKFGIASKALIGGLGFMTILVFAGNTSVAYGMSLGEALSGSAAFRTFRTYVPFLATNPQDIANMVLKNLIFIGMVGVFIMMAIGGFMYLTSASSQEQTGKAKDMMIDAAVGFGLMMISYVVVRQIIKMMTGTSPV